MKIRSAVREDLAQLSPGDLVLVACSGGADSVGLALALLEVAEEFSIRVGVISIDHQLQEGSGERARKLIEQFKTRGVQIAEVISVEVGTEGGLEAAARSARYQALQDAAERFGATAVYLGHTASDQAESVLLGLARGSGARSLSGMARVNGIYRRPLLGLTRSQVRTEVEASGFPIWDDPHNDDASFTRVRVRRLLADAEREIGPGIETALVRTAALLRDDADALDAITEEFYPKVRRDEGLDLESIMEYPRAVRTRMIKRYLQENALPAVTAEHIDLIEALASQWRGQGAVALPGHFDAARKGGVLTLSPRG